MNASLLWQFSDQLKPSYLIDPLTLLCGNGQILPKGEAVNEEYRAKSNRIPRLRGH